MAPLCRQVRRTGRDMTKPLLSVRGLTVTYQRESQEVHAVTGIDLQVEAGQTLAIVGESGAGKSTVGAAIAGLVRPTAGTIEIDGSPIETSRLAGRQRHARVVQTVFQDPYGSLNPARTIRDTLLEPMVRVLGLSKSLATQRAGDLLVRVGLEQAALNRYPGQFSGGQRQRIAIARALTLEPRVIVCDEPVSALDLSVQAQVLNLLLEIQTKQNVAFVFISHDLGVVRHIAHSVLVMRTGARVESGPVDRVLASPTTAYTRQLLLATFVPDPKEQAIRRALRHQTSPEDAT